MDKIKETFQDFFSVRSIVVLMFYGTTCWLWIHGKDIPPQLAAMDATLLTHFICTTVPGLMPDQPEPKK